MFRKKHVFFSAAIEKPTQWHTQDFISEGGGLNFHKVLYLTWHVELCCKQKLFFENKAVTMGGGRGKGNFVLNFPKYKVWGFKTFEKKLAMSLKIWT